MRGRSFYAAQIRAIPLLSAEEEYSLASGLYWFCDAKAGVKIARAHLRLVYKLAFDRLGYNLSIDDLVGYGNIGMTKALYRFDPDRGCRFATYARWWIEQAMNLYAIENHSIVRAGTTGGQRKVFYNLQKTMRKLGIITIGHEQLAPDEVTRLAKAIGVRESDVVAGHRLLSQSDQSLDAPVGDSNSSRYDYRMSEEPTPEDIVAELQERERYARLLARGMRGLSPRELNILTQRRLKEDPATLEELGDAEGVSRERIRQLQVRAEDKIKKALRSASPIFS